MPRLLQARFLGLAAPLRLEEDFSEVTFLEPLFERGGLGWAQPAEDTGEAGGVTDHLPFPSE